MRIKDIRGIRIQLEEIYDSLMTLRKAVAILHTEIEKKPRVVRHRRPVEHRRPEIVLCHSDELEDLDQVEERPDAGDGIGDEWIEPSRNLPDADKKYVEPIRIAGKLEIQIGMLDGRHNREFCLHTMHHLTRESGRDGLTPFWTTRLKTEELIELKEAIIEALLTASRWDFDLEEDS